MDKHGQPETNLEIMLREASDDARFSRLFWRSCAVLAVVALIVMAVRR